MWLVTFLLGCSTPNDATDADTADTDALLPPGCGDLECLAGETCAGCPVDCGPCTAACNDDGACDGASGETCTACGDCDTRDPVCGNGECQAGEDPAGCMADCGPVPWPADWAALEAEALEEMNWQRTTGADCPSGPKAAVPAIVMDDALQRGARLHSWDQSFSDYFAHDSCNGRSPWDREITAAGENIAWGYDTPASAVAGWMSSTTGHCEAIMDGSFTEVGIGFSDVGGDALWTAMFH